MQKMRSLLTTAFRDKKDATSVHSVNRLIVMGRMELEETLMLWKGPSHVRSRPLPKPLPPPAPLNSASECARDPRVLCTQVSNFFDDALAAEKKRAAKPKGFLENFLDGA
jgi:hypothetical protein